MHLFHFAKNSPYFYSKFESGAKVNSIFVQTQWQIRLTMQHCHYIKAVQLIFMKTEKLFFVSHYSICFQLPSKLQKVFAQPTAENGIFIIN